MLRIALIYTQYDHWTQPYIATWEKKINELGVTAKPFIKEYHETSNNIPYLFSKNKTDTILRAIQAFVFSWKKSTEYMAHTSFSNIKAPIKDVANFYPLLSFSPDIIHFIEYHDFPKYANFLKNTRSKSIVSFRGGDVLVNPWSNAWSKNYLQSIFFSADQLHFVSNHIRDEALKLGAPEDKCVVIYPGIDINYFSKNDRARIPKVFNKFRLVTTARLVWEKGIDYALGAIKQLVSRGYSLEYIIIGDGPDQRRLQFLRHQYGLDAIVHFLGKQSPAIIKDLLEDADIYVQPSLSEAICVAIMEACSMRLPIVSTKVGGIPELVLDTENGLLVQPQNPEKLADAIERLINNESIRLKMGERSRQIAEQKFSLENEVLNWERLYLSSIG